MKITSSQYASALLDAVETTDPKDHDRVLENFVKILAANGDLEKYEEIEKEYKILEMKAKGISQAEVTVAREMEVNSVLMDQLNRIVKDGVGADNIRPLQVQINKKIDESIIGGVVVKVDDTLIDASVRGQLNNLNQSLKS